jgi:hypothetical protein
MLSKFLSLKCFGLRDLQACYNIVHSGFVNGDCIFHRREDRVFNNSNISST